MAPATVLILPGLGNSPPGHWQSWLERRMPALRRVDLGDWDAPAPEVWAARLEEAVTAAVTPAAGKVAGPVVLVAHSLSCILVARWAASGTPAVGKVAGALLVAPPDVDAPDGIPAEAARFAPVPVDPLPFPALVVGSRNDPYCRAERACAFAVAWGADFIDAGEAGHINADSGHGPWPMGETLLRHLLEEAAGG
ncbi:RBBP9/YdeN family alpha/beta hydrolase [Azospirillum thermophilum]|uniref:Alpha/beta hydrolase n=1 Tax=Azospirillum thermophilum TaxID=2202148 RepID=A0A2S2CWW0_9PROT|nr:alpha/beta hydrolase [Azospirillum thermophilum]AWK88905.1 alpha/beta hydrolase [Azospirillum thermophilum]